MAGREGSFELVCRDAVGSAVREMALQHGARFVVQLLCTELGRAQQAHHLT